MSASSSSGQQPSKTYFSSGQALQSPPLAARIQNLFNDIYAFGGLYLTTLFSTDPMAAAASSPYSVQGRNATRTGGSGRPLAFSNRLGGGGGGGGGSGGYGGGPRTLGNSGGFTFASSDQVRVPGCGSCG